MKPSVQHVGYPLRRLLYALLTLVSCTAPALLVAQTPPPPASSGASAASTPDSSRRWWLSGQVNAIYQWHPAFPALYSGTNSLRPERENATSRLATVYTGLRIGARTELLLDLETAGGGGLSQAFGLAGFTNLDVVRNPTLGSAPYVARALIRHTIALGAEREPATLGPLALLNPLPVRRLNVAIGKLSMPDFFDGNTAGSDSHLQFMNWTVDNNGAYDYAADTRGYTIGAVAEYRARAWAVRWGEAVMPTVANGIEYDWQLSQAHGDNLEVELDRGIIPHHAGVVRLLGYVNHANMGSYREAIDAYVGGRDSVLDVAAHRRPGRTKAGVGVNVEQSVGRGLTVFGRAGLSNGRVESFAYTEVDRSVELGTAWTELPWRRSDRLGIAFVRNGLAPDHREYLARGGLGFLLGDGGLTYAPEAIVEAYYTCAVGWGLSLAFDIQHVANPGYNRDRGPVTVFALRAHLDVPGSP
jgi:high affinity Mn2+ porin